jgi:glycosyltransferase involved in cell wall biosynthesis
MNYLCWVPGEYFGGCEAYAVRLVEHLRSLGWRVTVACPHARCASEMRRRLDGVRVLELPDVALGGHFPGRAFLLRFLQWSRYAACLLRIRPDIVHNIFPWHQSSRRWIEVNTRRRSRMLFTFQLVPSARPPDGDYVTVFRNARERGARFCAISKHNQRLLCEYYGFAASDVGVIPNRPRTTAGAKLSAAERAKLRRDLGVPESALLITTVGRLHEQKGYDLIAMAIGRIVSAFPQARFLWLGEGEQRSALDALLAQQGVSERVLRPGWRDDVPPLLAASDLFLFPTRYEGGESFAIGEAVAAGLPVVTSDASGIPELLRDGEDAYLFPVNDHAALATAVCAALSDPTEAARRARSAAARLAAYTESDMLRDTVTLLESTAQMPVNTP